ncbi:hypothetical protein V1260_01810 [Brachybacterium sp. J144]|uniref:WXG100 family type VII secretion target n=1 Tax=Brachybacterium sp. J144 TaxID=3116487 RepID=UPI002E75B9FB|nr:hypothetical protein [Brachybacterium sp. J144]MEE1649522.1 hypothetical protein [Brachybacterium sp. J144]
MAFKGMNPDEGRDVAQSLVETGETMLEAIETVTSIVNSVEWIGPDYDAYQEEWNSFVGGPVNNLLEGLKAKGDELTKHADDQDDTSNAG